MSESEEREDDVHDRSYHLRSVPYFRKVKDYGLIDMSHPDKEIEKILNKTRKFDEITWRKKKR